MRNKGSEFGNDMIYIYDFIKHDMLLYSDLHVFKALHIEQQHFKQSVRSQILEWTLDNPNLSAQLLNTH